MKFFVFLVPSLLFSTVQVWSDSKEDSRLLFASNQMAPYEVQRILDVVYGQPRKIEFTDNWAEKLEDFFGKKDKKIKAAYIQIKSFFGELAPGDRLVANPSEQIPFIDTDDQESKGAEKNITSWKVPISIDVDEVKRYIGFARTVCKSRAMSVPHSGKKIYQSDCKNIRFFPGTYISPL